MQQKLGGGRYECGKNGSGEESGFQKIWEEIGGEEEKPRRLVLHKSRGFRT